MSNKDAQNPLTGPSHEEQSYTDAALSLGVHLDTERSLPEFAERALAGLEADGMVVLIEPREKAKPLVCRHTSGLTSDTEAWKSLPNRLSRRVSETKGRFIHLQYLPYVENPELREACPKESSGMVLGSNTRKSFTNFGVGTSRVFPLRSASSRNFLWGESGLHLTTVASATSSN